ncbi:hypothetical protein EDD86DRAFT_205668 [Gorgonomyces haynaldii]|nr:hypothetical protein EDD86DRAFT_205668 [Gorgonomyces haynaldii]
MPSSECHSLSTPMTSSQFYPRVIQEMKDAKTPLEPDTLDTRFAAIRPYLIENATIPHGMKEYATFVGTIHTETSGDKSLYSKLGTLKRKQKLDLSEWRLACDSVKSLLSTLKPLMAMDNVTSAKRPAEKLKEVKIKKFKPEPKPKEEPELEVKKFKSEPKPQFEVKKEEERKVPDDTKRKRSRVPSNDSIDVHDGMTPKSKSAKSSPKFKKISVCVDQTTHTPSEWSKLAKKFQEKGKKDSSVQGAIYMSAAVVCLMNQIAQLYEDDKTQQSEHKDYEKTIALTGAIDQIVYQIRTLRPETIKHLQQQKLHLLVPLMSYG